MAQQIDSQKMTIILEDALNRLKFLVLIKPDDELSSELAGYEISKLLKDQSKLEGKYAELVELRTSLVGITKKAELLKTQNEIHNVANKLKESTKKLCRLFKENPDLEKDGFKVKNDTNYLKETLEALTKNIKDGQQQKFYSFITAELDNQDKLRKIISQEKELIQEKKRLENEKALEYKEYQNETKDKQEIIQNQKDKLARKRIRAELKKQYAIKESKAVINQQQLIYNNIEDEIQKQIKNMEQKIEIETQVSGQLKQFLVSKEEEIKKETDKWQKLTDEKRIELEEIIEKKLVERDDLQRKLNAQRELKAKENLEQKEAERLEMEDDEKKKETELQKIRLDNAISLIQNEYWNVMKYGRGSFGKGKKKKGAKKKK